jgi:hypothetical protein
MTSQRIREVVLVLCTAAIAAPAAQATFQDSGAGPTATSDDKAYEHGRGRGGTSPWKPAETISYPRGDRPRTNLTGTEWATYSESELVTQPKRPVVIDRRPIVLESGGFDWADAGIGAAGAAGLALVGGGAVLLARRGRRGEIATSE